VAKISNNICMFGAGCLWALVSLEVFIWLTSDVRLMFYYLPYSISIFLLLTSSTVNGFVLGKINTCQLGKLSTMGLMLTGFSSVLLTAYVINHAIYEGNLFDFVKKVVVYIIIPLNITLAVALLACFRYKISDKNKQTNKEEHASSTINCHFIVIGRNNALRIKTDRNIFGLLHHITIYNRHFVYCDPVCIPVLLYHR
jgi:hypothetical protein